MSRFGHLLTDTVTVAAESGVNGFCKSSYAAQSEVPSRVEEDHKIIMSSDGTQIAVSHVISSEVSIPLRARMWLPDDDTSDDNDAKIVVFIERASFPDGSGGMYVARL